MDENRSLRVYHVDDEDRISNLPESLICHILALLPTRTAVATSVLSKTWKFLWKKVTSLNFILRADGVDDDTDGFQYGDDMDAETVRKFVRFVNKVLLHSDSQRFQKFQLCWFQGCKQDPEYTSIWISYAIGRSVRELNIIALCRSSLDLHLPASLFTCATLEVLKLGLHMVFQVPSAVHLPKLQVLELGFLLYESNQCIPRLLSGCHVLRSLVIGRNYRDTMLDFRVFSPSLRDLYIYRFDEGVNKPFDGKLELDAPNLEWFILEEVLKECLVKRRLTSVNSVKLNLDHDVFPDDNDFDELCTARYKSTVKLLEAMQNVKYMSLEGTIIKALSHAVFFERLIELDVSVQCCNWYPLGGIIGWSAKLQNLKITKVGCGKNTTDDHRLGWTDPTKVPECLSSSLLKVSVFGFEDLEDEMKMIKYILNHGEVLESFTLKSNVNTSGYKNKYQLLQHVATFSRCSRACQLHFY